MPVVIDIHNIIFICIHFSLESNIPLIQVRAEREKFEHKYFTDK